MKPLVREIRNLTDYFRSIHPQGWVPIETALRSLRHSSIHRAVAFTPKGRCPLKLVDGHAVVDDGIGVAFTPKGGCPLKRLGCALLCCSLPWCSIHPQGWVPIETYSHCVVCVVRVVVAFTPKGGCKNRWGVGGANAVRPYCQSRSSCRRGNQASLASA